MVPKYTILKVIIQSFSKITKSNKGFTLIELIVGMSIMLIVGSLAMNAFIQASTTFNKDKKSIDSSQSMSAILEIIGSDIKQSGENINDASFPVIKIEKIATGDLVNMPGSSKITIRRALTTPLTLCEPITATSTNTTLTVTDDSLSEPNCKLGTPVTVGTIIRPTTVKEARNKRCQLDDVNGDYTTPATSDFCLTTKASPDKEKVLAAMSDKSGHMRTFQYVDDTDSEDVTYGSPAATGKKYKISISGLSADSTNTYKIGDPIYLVEERVYRLDKEGNFILEIDGGASSNLMKRIKKFNVAARVYGDKETREPDAIDPATPAIKPNLLPKARRCDVAIPNYICEFNTTSIDDWKTLQGIKVDLQAKYDGTGQSATASTAELEKLSAGAEFFPRNVLSK